MESSAISRPLSFRSFAQGLPRRQQQLLCGQAETEPVVFFNADPLQFPLRFLQEFLDIRVIDLPCQFHFMLSRYASSCRWASSSTSFSPTASICFRISAMASSGSTVPVTSSER